MSAPGGRREKWMFSSDSSSSAVGSSGVSGSEFVSGEVYACQGVHYRT